MACNAGRTYQGQKPLVGEMKGMASTRHSLHPTRFVRNHFVSGYEWRGTPPLFIGTHLAIKQSSHNYQAPLRDPRARRKCSRSTSGSLGCPGLNAHRTHNSSAQRGLTPMTRASLTKARHDGTTLTGAGLYVSRLECLKLTLNS